MNPNEELHVDDRRWWILSVLCLSLVMVILGNTVLNVAIPTLVRELDASATQLQWMVDAYGLVFAGLLLTCGALGDRFGRKGALQAGLVIFGLASLVSTQATEPAHLMATRAVMGIGAALVMPATLSILTKSSRHRSARGRSRSGPACPAPAPPSGRSPAAGCSSTSTGVRCSS